MAKKTLSIVPSAKPAAKEAAKPAATPTAKPAPKETPKAPAKPAAKPAPKEAKPAAKETPKAPAKPANAFAIHVNKTGRVCFGKDAAERLGDAPYCTLTIDGQRVRLEPAKKDGDNALPVRDANGRPYVSATKQFKPLGFDGSRPYDIEAKPYGNAGFEFKLA